MEVIDGDLDRSDDADPDLLVVEDVMFLLVGFLMLGSKNNDSIQQVVKADGVPVQPVFFWKYVP